MSSLRNDNSSKFLFYYDGSVIFLDRILSVSTRVCGSLHLCNKIFKLCWKKFVALLLTNIYDDIAFYASSAIPAASLAKQVPDAGKSNFAHDRNYGVTMLHGPEPCITINFLQSRVLFSFKVISKRAQKAFFYMYFLLYNPNLESYKCVFFCL